MSNLIERIGTRMDEIAHMLIEDYPQGDYMDGYVAALEAVLKALEEEQ